MDESKQLAIVKFALRFLKSNLDPEVMEALGESTGFNPDDWDVPGIIDDLGVKVEARL
jgi:hypothetical protein